MYIAIDIGGTKTIISGFRDRDPKTVLFSNTLPTDRNFEKHLKAIIDIVKNNTKNVLGIGIAHVGIIDREDRICKFSNNLQEYENKPLVKTLEKEFNCPVFIENDLVCGGLAEAIFGWGANFDTTFYFTASTGIGGAFVYKDNKDYRFEQVEAGHFVIKGEGLTSISGQVDIIESYVGGKSMEERFLRKPEEINDLLLWEKQVKYLAVAVINSYVMFKPQVFVLGGGMIEQNEYLREKLILETKEQLKVYKTPIIKVSRMGKSVVSNGALALVR